MFPFKYLAAISTFAVTISPIYANCLKTHPELYDYSGTYTSGRSTISLEVTTPSGRKKCELISREEAIGLGGYELFKNIYNDGTRRNTTGKCENLLVNLWDTRLYDDNLGYNIRLKIIPFKPSISKLINALPSGWSGESTEGRFSTGKLYYAVKYKKQCKKEGEYYTIDRKFFANTPKSELIYTREVTFSKIDSQ